MRIKLTLKFGALLILAFTVSCKSTFEEVDPHEVRTIGFADLSIARQSYYLTIPPIPFYVFKDRWVVKLDSQQPSIMPMKEIIVESLESEIVLEPIETEPISEPDPKVIAKIDPDILPSKILPNYKYLPRVESESVVRSLQNTQFCQNIDNKLRGVTFRNCLDSELKNSNYSSVKGRPILYTDYLELDTRRSLGKILLLGGVYGDELTSVSSVFAWMNILGKHHSGLFVWRVVLVVNLDGFFLKQSSRTNANRVDPNRNMPTENWDDIAKTYWITEADGSERKFPGLRSGSEPETKWLIGEIERFHPDIIISVHVPYNLVDYDAKDRKDAPRRLGILTGRSLGTYPGSLERYVGEQQDILVITIELPHSNKMLAERDIKYIWSDLILWLKNNISNRQGTGFVQEVQGNTLG